MTLKLAKAGYVYNLHPEITPGLRTDLFGIKQMTYPEVLRLSRYFYRRDPIASTVVNRIADIAATELRNQNTPEYGEGEFTVEEKTLYDSLAKLIQPVLRAIVISYLVDGMAIPQYEIHRVQGTRINNALGRTQYQIPRAIWLRNPENIILKKTFEGNRRRAYIRIPQEDVNFILNKGVWADDIKDTKAYLELREEFPDYVAAIERGERIFPINDFIIYRNLLSWNDYPLPYLEAALDPLDHKRYLKMMDRATASRAIEAFRHVTVGSDLFPADDEDIEETRKVIDQKSSIERVFNLFTNHTVNISWVIPDLAALLDEKKYIEANADIFFALGFPRILTVGETEKSNAADNKIAALGVLSMMQGIQQDVLQWVKQMYREVALLNGIKRVAEPYFAPVQIIDVTMLLTQAAALVQANAISRETIAALYGSDFSTELQNMLYEYEAMETLRESDNDSDSTTPQERNSPAPERELRETDESDSEYNNPHNK